MFENIGRGHGLESGKRNRGPAVQADAIGRAAAGSGGKRGAAVEAEANREQQLKWMPRLGPGAAAEADASGEQQLKRTQSGSSSAQRAVRRRITHGRRTRGK